MNATTPGILDPPLPYTGGRIPASLAVGAVEALDPAQFSRGFESIFGNPRPFGRR